MCLGVVVAVWHRSLDIDLHSDQSAVGMTGTAVVLVATASVVLVA